MILKFKDAQVRDAFVATLAKDHPDLASLVKPSYSQADTLTVREGDLGDASKVRELAGKDAETFHDVRFSSTDV